MPPRKRPVGGPRKERRGYQPNGHEYVDKVRTALEKGRESPATRANIGSDYTDEEREFIMACEREKRRLNKINLSCADVLALAKRLGYRLEEKQNG